MTSPISNAAQMRAFAIIEPGVDGNTAVIDCPVPRPGPNQVMIKVAYAGCNFSDLMLRRGDYPHLPAYPIVPGSESSGFVVAVGTEVQGLREGDRVFAFTEKGGGYAEYCCTEAHNVALLPDGIDLVTGAAFPAQALTAWHLLHTVADVGAGDTVLIHAIGGGVGLQCTQLARLAGASVIGTVSQPGKEERALAYGAQRVISRQDEDFVTVALEITGGRGVDLGIDSLGATVLDRTFDAVRGLGHIISIGEAEGTPFPNLRERLLIRSQTFSRFHIGHTMPGSTLWRDGLAHVLEAIGQGRLLIPVEGIFELEEVDAMHRKLASRTVSGKLVVSVGGDTEMKKEVR